MMTENKNQDGVFPAHAGMSPEQFLALLLAIRFPRTRGDEPDKSPTTSPNTSFSPHTRG